MVATHRPQQLLHWRGSSTALSHQIRLRNPPLLAHVCPDPVLGIPLLLAGQVRPPSPSLTPSHMDLSHARSLPAHRTPVQPALFKPDPALPVDRRPLSSTSPLLSVPFNAAHPLALSDPEVILPTLHSRKPPMRAG